MSKYLIVYTPKAISDIRSIEQSGDKQAAIKLVKLLEEITEHSRIGIGKP